MEITPEFKKDLSSNYMILCPLKTKEDSFLIKMLARNHIDGLLKIEIKIVDNKRYYYYDITGKQTLYDIIEKNPISFLQLKKIYSKLLQLPDICKEFLIDENGIFIEPNFVYIDASFDSIEFCYYPGVDQELQKQIGKITEYLLNRVDYKDEQAVLAVYALYQVSHDKNCTLEKLKDVFERQCKNIDNEKKELSKRKLDKKELAEKEYNREKKNFSQERGFKTENLQDEYRKGSKKQKEENIIQEKIEDGSMKSRIKKLDINMEYNKKNEKEEIEKKQKEKKEQKNKIGFPYMEERVENQKEVLEYPKKVYIKAIFILILGLAVLFILMKSGILSINGKPDSKRCMIAIVCYISILFTAFFIIFRKENKVAKIEENVDYIDWEEDYDSLPMPEIYGLTVSEPIEKNYYQDAFLKETGNNSSFGKNQNEIDNQNKKELDDEDMETELLIDFSDHSIAYLESEFSGERIYLKKFPFLIGKLRKGTDYILENNKISRVHAKFDYDESHHFIEDMDSTNGTSVNGSALLAHDRTMIFDGDKVCFADKNFIFHC